MNIVGIENGMIQVDGETVAAATLENYNKLMDAFEAHGISEVLTSSSVDEWVEANRFN